MTARVGQWRARLRNNGFLYNLGLFDSPEEASAAYLAAKARFKPHAAVLGAMMSNSNNNGGSITNKNYGIGPQLAELRKSRNMTASFVAAQIGVTSGNMSHFEVGKSMLPLVKIKAYAHAIGYRMSLQFEALDEIPQPPPPPKATIPKAAVHFD